MSVFNGKPFFSSGQNMKARKNKEGISNSTEERAVDIYIYIYSELTVVKEEKRR